MQETRALSEGKGERMATYHCSIKSGSRLSDVDKLIAKAIELDSHGSPNRSTDIASINKQNAAASKGIGSSLKALTGSPGVGGTSTKRSNGGGRPAKAANSKGSGASAAAHVDYIDREGKYEEKGDLEFKETGNLPAWANSAREFWAAADELERANGRIYTEIEVALPREITPDERRELVQGFIEEQLGKRHPYTVAIHNPPAALEGGEQPHAHIMFCDRTLDGIERSREQFFKRAAAPYRDRKTKEMVAPDPSKGGAAKAKEWQGRDKVFQVRESWERHYNNAVIFTDFQVSCKSLKAQGIDRQPERHLGPKMARLKSWEAGKIVEARSDRQELEEIEREINRLSREIEATPQDIVVPPQPEKTGTSPTPETKTVKKQEIDQTPDLTRRADPKTEDLRPRDTISSDDPSKNTVGDITSPVVTEGNGQSEALPPVKETSLPIQQPAFDSYGPNATAAALLSQAARETGRTRATLLKIADRVQMLPPGTIIYQGEAKPTPTDLYLEGAKAYKAWCEAHPSNFDAAKAHADEWNRKNPDLVALLAPAPAPQPIPTLTAYPSVIMRQYREYAQQIKETEPAKAKLLQDAAAALGRVSNAREITLPHPSAAQAEIAAALQQRGMGGKSR